MTNSPRGILWAVLVDRVANPITYPTNAGIYALFDAATQKPLVIQKRFEHGEPHHVTLQYDVEKSAVEHLIGKRFIARLTKLRQDDRAQAFRVVLPADIAPLWKGDTIPHLTVSYKEYPVHGGKAALDGEVTGSNPIDVEFAIAFHQFQPKE